MSCLCYQDKAIKQQIVSVTDRSTESNEAEDSMEECENKSANIHDVDKISKDKQAIHQNQSKIKIDYHRCQ